MSTQSQPLPVALVESLIRGPLRFSSHEFRMLLALAVAERPVTAWALARHLSADYSHTKRVARALLTARVVRRGPRGLRLETDVTRWRVPRSAPEGGRTRAATPGTSGAPRVPGLPSAAPVSSATLSRV